MGATPAQAKPTGDGQQNPEQASGKQPFRFYTPGDARTRGGQHLRQQHTNKDLYRYSFVPREWSVLSD